MTATLTTPVEIDTAIAEAHEAVNQIVGTIARQERTVIETAGGRRSGYGSDATWNMTVAEAVTILTDKLAANPGATDYYHSSIRVELARLAELRDERTKRIAKRDQLEDLYTGWSRFFLVTSSAGGHIHSSMRCSTCRFDTEFGWLPTLSGLTEAEAVAAHGAILCTVCYPTAPVEWTGGISHTAQAAKDERAAAKAKREADKAAKAIFDLDGEPLKDEYGYTIKTEITARRELSGALQNLCLGYDETKWTAYAERLAAAIANKTGESAAELLAATRVKAAKTVAKWQS